MPYQTVPPNSSASPVDAQYWVGAANSTLTAEKNLGGFTGVVFNTAGVPSAADPALQYISPAKTANTASATTITLPETGLLAPITGTTQIDFITKPTGDAPRLVFLWFQSSLIVRESVAGAGAGTTNINLMPGGTATVAHTFPANSLLPLFYDGSQWRKAFSVAHWTGSGLRGDSAQSEVILNGGTGAALQHTSARQVLCDSTGITLTASQAVLTTRPKLTKATVASASNVTLTAGCPFVLLTGTTTINTFTATGWSEGMVVWLKFDNILTITNNSGGANDFVSKDGTSNITTTAGMVLEFMFDGTDMREVGRV